VVADGDLDQMVRRLEQLIVDPALYRAFSDRARDTVLRKFDIVKQAEKVRSIYLTSIANSTRRASRRRWWAIGAE